MDSSSPEIWLSFTSGAQFHGPEPAFFDLSDQDWVRKIEENYGTIKQELLQLIKREENLIPYFNKSLAKELTWKIFPFLLWGKENSVNIEKCPKTFELLRSCPDLLSASFSLLSAQTDIRPHYGDANVMYRCHLGLVIPESEPKCALEVKGEQKGWEEGKIFAFCDAHYHRAWNHSDQRRAVLVFDVLRPEFKPKKKWIIAQVRTSLFWLHLIQSPFIINKMPFFFKKFIVKLPALAVYPFLRS